MHKKEIRGWLKHIDFIVLDIVMLQICFVLSYWIWMGIENPYSYYAPGSLPGPGHSVHEQL